MGCSCDKFDHIPLDRKELNKRAKETNNIVKSLDLIAVHPDKEHKLYCCNLCGQYWQLSLDWVGGNKKYIFKVDNITKNLWIEKPFIQVDELMNFTSRIINFIEMNDSFEEKEDKCKKENCDNHSMKFSLFCLIHHIENIGIKTKYGENLTWFEPYLKDNYELKFDELVKLDKYKRMK